MKLTVKVPKSEVVTYTEHVPVMYKFDELVGKVDVKDEDLLSVVLSFF